MIPEGKPTPFRLPPLSDTDNLCDCADCRALKNNPDAHDEALARYLKENAP
ncbi:MAG: hypothetical protein ACE5FN_11430 [Leptospirillia bacterium]